MASLFDQPGGAAQKPAPKKKAGGMLANVPGYNAEASKGNDLVKPVSALLGLVGAPQQTILHSIKGIGEAVTGHGHEALTELGRAATSPPRAIASVLPFGPKNDTLTFTGSLEPFGVKKLPYGLETAGSLATDPLTYLTLGTGGAARGGLTATEEVLGAEARQAVRKAGLKALTEEQQSALRSHIVEQAAKDVGEKKAAKIAETQMNALKSRARGGIGLHVPGTNIEAHVAGSFERPFERLAEKSPTYRAARNLFSEVDHAEEARVSRNLSQSKNLVKDVDTLADEALPYFIPKGTGEKVNTFLGRMGAEPVRDEGIIAKTSQAWRRQAVTYPGTVVNRLRQAAFYGLADGQRPDQWIRYMARGGKSYTAYESLAKEMGLKSAEEAAQNVDFVRRLSERIGEKAVREEFAFRQFAEEPTYFTGTERRGATTKLGQAAQKVITPVSKGGQAIRSTGNLVEEASRRANFLHNLETRYGNYAEAGAHTRHVLPGVKAASEAERQLQKVSPFWSAMRADWQSVLRMGAESPGRVSALTRAAQNIGGVMPLPGGGTVDLNQLTQRHVPPLELAQALQIPAELLHGDIDASLNAASNLTGGPGIKLLQQMFVAWQRDNQDIPPRQQMYQFLKEMHPQITRLPSIVEETVSGKAPKKNVSLTEALLKFGTGLAGETGQGASGGTATSSSTAKKKTGKSLFD